MSEKFIIIPLEGVKIKVTEVRSALCLLENSHRSAILMSLHRHLAGKTSFLQEMKELLTSNQFYCFHPFYLLIR